MHKNGVEYEKTNRVYFILHRSWNGVDVDSSGRFSGIFVDMYLFVLRILFVLLRMLEEWYKQRKKELSIDSSSHRKFLCSFNFTGL